jgi:hypothetical protein
VNKGKRKGQGCCAPVLLPLFSTFTPHITIS